MKIHNYEFLQLKTSDYLIFSGEMSKFCRKYGISKLFVLLHMFHISIDDNQSFNKMWKLRTLLVITSFYNRKPVINPSFREKCRNFVENTVSISKLFIILQNFDTSIDDNESFNKMWKSRTLHEITNFSNREPVIIPSCREKCRNFAENTVFQSFRLFFF